MGDSALEAARFAEGIGSVLSGQRQEFTMEYPYHSSGERRWFVGRVMRLVIGDEQRAVITHEDITERKLTEEKLLGAEAKNRAMLEAVPDLMFRITRDGEYLDFRARDEGKLYVPPERFVGRNLREIMPPEGDGEPALRRFSSFKSPDLVVLDIMLPGIDGISVCQEIRRTSNVPIVVLTARDGERDVVVGLEVGADDYVTKPVNPAELVSRVRAHLRRRRMDAEDRHQRLDFPGLVIDLPRRQVWAGEASVYLTATEFEILSFLATHPGQVFSRLQIMEHLWDGAFFGETRSTVVHIQHIREKIEPDPKKLRYIHTVRGIGYKFAVDGDLASLES